MMLLFLSVVVVTQAIHLQNDLEVYMQDLDFLEDDSFLLLDSPDSDLGFDDGAETSWSEDESVRRLWGVPDTSASVGKLLSHPIPKEAFAGNVERYLVTGLKGSALPSWMTFNEDTNSLEGIPTGADIGTHYVIVYGVGATPGSKAKDMFAVEVVPSTPSTPVTSACGERGLGRISVASLMLDLSLQHISAQKRVALLRNAARYLRVAEENIRIIGEDDTGSQLDDATIAGPGNVARMRPHGTLLQWQVGCEGEVWNKKEFSQFCKEAKDGTLHEVSGYPVMGWYVNAVSRLLSRESRQVGSGDHEDIIDDDADELVNIIVPTMSSPVFPDPSPHPHRHHHQGERHPSATPVSVYIPMSTPVLGPIMPSKVVSAEIPEPTMIFTEDVVSSYPEETVLEPSMEHSVTPELTLFTEPLSSISLESTRAPTASETFEEGMLNSPPTVNQRLRKLQVIAGKEYRKKIPNETFLDFEDGYTESLILFLKDEKGRDLDRHSWLQFDQEKQELYGIAMESQMGKYDYELYAYDSENKSVNDTIHIRVDQDTAARLAHHEFNITFKLDKESNFPNAAYWKLELIHRIAELFGDENTENIMVFDITEEPYRISWRNYSLPHHSCPKHQIKHLYKTLSDDVLPGHSGAPSKALLSIMAPEFRVEKVSVRLLELCSKVEVPKRTDKTPIKPTLRNPIDEIPAVVGEMLYYKVPSDTFWDAEDGSSDNMKLSLVPVSYVPLAKSSWLQFDSRNQLFYGVPLEEDIGTKAYNLHCTDSHDNTVNEALEVKVTKRLSNETFNVEFSIHMEGDLEEFNADGTNRVKVINHLARAFGDLNASSIVVKTITKGSVVFAWHNRSLPFYPCPHADIEQLRKIMLHENKSLTDSFKREFQPDFILLLGDVMPIGICIGGDTPTNQTLSEVVGTAVEPGDEDDDHLITFILPAIVIAIMLLIAAIIACILYRKRSRQGKMTMVDNRTFVSKGIPIIFQEELEDKPEPPKNPVIMKDEKPPLPPPEYPRVSGGTPKPERGEEELEDYQPPPPFTASRDSSRQARPKATPTYRKPPPYVPP